MADLYVCQPEDVYGRGYWAAREPGDLYRPPRYLRSSMIPTVNVGMKVGRNEPCPCGSGRKHKRCCQ